LNLEGQKISGSRNWAVWGLDFLTRYDPDPLRYYLTTIMPEARDTDWDWNEFFHHNNDELVATWGNLVNRVLSFAYKNWDGIVPQPGQLTAVDQELLEQIENGFTVVGREIEAVHLRSALAEAIRLASEVNKYLDETAPWFTIKQDKAAAARCIYVAMRAIDSLKILFSPFLPFSSARLHQYLGFSDELFGQQSTQIEKDDLGEHTVLRYHPPESAIHWQPSQLKPGQPLRPPQPLFKKLEEKIVAEERARLGQKPE
jgi:methionyl-tRNA synthetase